MQTTTAERGYPDLDGIVRRHTEHRAARREEIKSALDAGLKIQQCGRLWPDCSPFLPEITADHAYLAAHIEARENGLGMRALTVEVIPLASAPSVP